MSPTPHVFTLGCTPLGKFADGYRAHMGKKNKRLNFCYLPDKGAKVAPNADVYLVENVTTFAALKNRFKPSAVAVVADSPLLLAELPAAQMLDTTMDSVWRMRLHAVSYSSIERARQQHAKSPVKTCYTEHPVEKIDALGLVIDKVSGGNILSSLNAIMFQLTPAQRHEVRREMYRYLNGSINGKKLIAAVEKHAGSSMSSLMRGSMHELATSLEKKGALYREGVKLIRSGKSADTFAKKKRLSIFELRFLAKIVGQFEPKTEKGMKR